ncbi:MAG: HPr family phosphocarrier protein [Phycisphaerae bacterium]
MATVEEEVTIVNKYGLHARPAMQLVELANSFNSIVEVSNASLTVDAKSIMSVMRLGATMGTQLKIVADGEDAEQAVAALKKLVQEGFGEMEEDQAEPPSIEP